MEMLGPREDQVSEVRILNRIMRWTREGIEYEPDQRHAERIVEELGLDKCKAVSTPCTPASVTEAKIKVAEDVDMTMEHATRYRALAARGMYLAQDRSGIWRRCKRAVQDDALC